MSIIIPGCSDLNRGDQALVWEVERIMKECGFNNEYYFLCEENEPIKQSLDHGLKVVRPILEHPSRMFKNKNNLEYTTRLKIKWGCVSLIDFIRSLLLLSKVTRWAVKPFLKKTARKSYSLFEQTDAVFVKGGGFIHAYGGLTATYYIYFSLYHIFLAQALNKPVYIFPNSIGPFEGPLVKWMVRRALKRCKFVSTRETYSQELIKKELQLEVHNFPDLAFYLPNGDLTKESFMAKYKLPTDRKLVALTMRPHRFPKSDTPKEDYIRFKKSIAGFSKWLYREGYMPVFVEHVLAVNYNENDGECIKEVCEYMDEKEYLLVSNRDYTCHNLKSIYSFFDYIIGTRFHSMIFSMGNNVPGIAITYTGNKGEGIMHDMGLDDYYVSINDVTFDLLKEKFTQLLENEPVVKSKIESYLVSAAEEREVLKSILVK